MRLYFQFVKMQFNSDAIHRLSFFFRCLGQFLMSFTEFLGIFFLLNRFGDIGGFTAQQVLLCFGLAYFSLSAAECVFSGFANFPKYISDGSFDRMMVRPRGLLFQVLGCRMDFTRLSKLLQAAVILACGVLGGGISWTLARACTFILMLLGGTLIFSGLFIIYAALCFFTLQGLEIMNVLTYGGREMMQYPIGVYGKGFLLVFTFLVPFACVQYYPLLTLLRPGCPWWWALLPLAGLLFFGSCLLLWRFGVRHYKSTGS